MDQVQGKVWYERALYYGEIGDKANAKKAYAMAVNYDSTLPSLPKLKTKSKDQLLRTLEIICLICIILIGGWLLYLIYGPTLSLENNTFPSRIIYQKGEKTESNKIISTSKPISYNRTGNSNFKLLQNALYYYIIDNQRFPATLDELVQKEYLKDIPVESSTGSNQVSNRFSGEGGWVYNPPKIFAANKIEEQIGVALFTNIKNIPYRLFRPLSLEVSLGKSIILLKEGNNFLKSWPISIGSSSTPTPTGSFRIIEKNILANGQENSYGSRWMKFGEHYHSDTNLQTSDTLAQRGIGIHGTNDPTDVGRSITQGCIRMRNEDIEELYQLIPNGIITEIITN